MEPTQITSVYPRAMGTLLLAFLDALLLASSMPPTVVAYSGNATYIDYKPEEKDWQLKTIHCESLDSKVSLAYRQRHRWAEFCGFLGQFTGVDGCHMCLQVTNEATSDDASVTVRIIDICDDKYDEDPVLWMDKVAFDQIDTDGQGRASGVSGDVLLNLNYDITDCQDQE